MNLILRYKTQIIAVFACILFLFILYIVRDTESSIETDDFSQLNAAAHQEKEKQSSSKEGVIMVDVKGAVEKPGVYEMDKQDRIKEAIEKAGGFTKTALKADVNLAQHVQDEMVILVAEEGETVSEGTENTSPVAQQSSEIGQKVNINRATEEELTSLTGIGPSKAEAIIQYREEHGLFSSADELMDVSGIGEKTFENIQDQVEAP